MNAHEVDVIAMALKKLYTAMLRARGNRWTGYRASDRNNDVWYKIAHLCIENDFNAEDHVRALVTSTRNPYPNMLLGPNAVERTRVYSTESTQNETLHFKAQLARLTGRLRVGDALSSILFDSTESFTPAFRVCIAKLCGVAGIAERYGEAAELELQLNRSLNSVINLVLSKGGVSDATRSALSVADSSNKGH